MRNKLWNTEFMNPNKTWARKVNQAIHLKLIFTHMQRKICAADSFSGSQF